MNLQNVKWILAREIRDQLRDRRTTFMIFVLPILLYPLLGVVFTQFSQFMLRKPSKVLVVGAADLPESPPLFENKRFAEALFTDRQNAELLELEFAPSEPREGVEPLPTDPDERRAAARQMMEEGGYDAAVVFPADFALRLRRAREAVRRPERHGDAQGGRDTPLGEVPSPGIIPNSGKAKSDITCEWLRRVLRDWSDQIGDANLKASEVPILAARPFVPMIEKTEQDKARSSARFWAQLFPIFMVVWAMTGAFYPAVDLCAGEKERGTLETLLSSPAKRSEIVLGKLLTIMLFSMTTSMLNLVSVAITGMAVMRILPNIGPPPWQAWIWLPLALVPVSALFSALCLALAAFARSTKEGQYYLMPLLLVTMPLVMAPLSPSLELTIGNALIPVTGLCLLLRALLEGQFFLALPMIVPVGAVTLLCCVLAIRWAVEQFNSESVLFRESERLDLVLWLKHLVRERQPTPTVAMAATCGIVILTIKFFLEMIIGRGQAEAGIAQFPSFGEIVRSTLTLHTLGILLPVVLMTAFFTRSPRQTLLLKLPRISVVPAVVLLAFVFHPVALALQSIVMQFYPIGGPMKQALEQLEQVFKAAPLWQAVLLIALLPAITEELAFRGFILSGFRHLNSKWRAIIYSAIFFGIAHGVLQQQIITCVIGVVIGYVAVKSGSLLPGMVFHFLHNALSVGITRLTPDMCAERPILDWLFEMTPNGPVYHTGVMIAGLVGTGVVLAWLSLQRHEPSAEEREAERLREER